MTITVVETVSAARVSEAHPGSTKPQCKAHPGALRLPGLLAYDQTALIQALDLCTKKGNHVGNKISTVFSKLGYGQMSTGEYQANLNGLNMFFGAVLGFVLTGTEKLNSFQFGVVLAMLAGAVISILYISSSRNRVVYSLYALAIAFTLPEMINLGLRVDGLVPDKIRPTLVVWTLMTILVEFWGREKSAPPQA